MKALQVVMILLTAILIAALVALPAKATEGDKLTYFTFSQPVELPGVSLPAGTYALKVLDTTGFRNIVQVYDKNLMHLYGTFLTITDYRRQGSDKSVIRFSETAEGGPSAIKEWFYPGDIDGFEFVYPHDRAAELAKASNQAVPSMASNMTSNIKQSAGDTAAQQSSKGAQQTNVAALENTPVKADQPSGGEAEVGDVFIIEAPASQPEGSNTIHNVDSEYQK